MSIQAMSWVMDQKLPCEQKFVLLMLADCSDSEIGNIFGASIPALSDRCGIDEDSVIRQIKDLESNGLLKIIRDKNSPKDVYKYNYILNIDDVVSP